MVVKPGSPADPGGELDLSGEIGVMGCQAGGRGKLPSGDGRLDPGQIDLLLGIGEWLAQNGAAIYDTVPWKIFAEGNEGRLPFTVTGPDGQVGRAVQPDLSKLSWKDVRFTRNGEKLYATFLGVPPVGEVVIGSLASTTRVSSENRIASVSLLGYGEIPWVRDESGLHEARKSGPSLSPQQAINMVNGEDGIFVDLRDAADYKKGHIVEAVNIPSAKLGERMAELEKYRDKPLVLVCKMGQQAGAAGKQLRAANYSKVYKMSGGMMEWGNLQLPMVS